MMEESKQLSQMVKDLHADFVVIKWVMAGVLTLELLTFEQVIK